MTAWPLLDGLARDRLTAGLLGGRRVALAVAADDGLERAAAVLAAAGASVDQGPDEAGAIVVTADAVVAAGAVVDTTAVDAGAWVQATVQAVLRLTNLRLAGKRVAVLGLGPRGVELSRVVRDLGGRVVAVDGDPERAWAAHHAGHDVADRRTALSGGELVMTTDGTGLDAADVVRLAPGTVVAASGGVDIGGAPTDHPRPGVTRAWPGERDIAVLAADALSGGRPTAAVDVLWTSRVLAVAWLAEVAPPAGAHMLPVEIRRDIATAALATRGVLHR